jgi:hypothetical protein
VIGSLDICYKECELIGDIVFQIHHSYSFGTASIVLSESCVLVLPVLSISELGKFPPAVEIFTFVSRYLDLVHDHVLECLKFVVRDSLVHLYSRRLLHLIESELRKSRHDLCLLLRREYGLDHAPCLIDDCEASHEGLQNLAQLRVVILRCHTILLNFCVELSH